eukprot:8889787-Pyramimonas_sp.AAC.1
MGPESRNHPGHPNLQMSMQALLKDVDSDGHLVNPRKWGLADAPAADAGAGDARAGRNKGTVSEEYKFWEAIKTGGFAVTTDGSKDASIAGRWQRACEDDPDMKQRYDKITGVGKNKKKAAFRSEWAKSQWSSIQDPGSTLR